MTEQATWRDRRRLFRATVRDLFLTAQGRRRDPATCAEARRLCRVVGADGVDEVFRAARARYAAQLDEVLDRNREAVRAMQRAHSRTYQLCRAAWRAPVYGPPFSGDMREELATLLEQIGQDDFECLKLDARDAEMLSWPVAGGIH
jgi:hypothetical protein